MRQRPALLSNRSIHAVAVACWWGCWSLAGPAAAQAPAGAPESAEIQRLIKEGQQAQALKLIDESLAKNPKDPQMRFRRGVALSMLDRKTEALAVFQKLVEDHPDMPAPYNNMAVIHGAQGDYDKARQALERAIRTNPAYATAYQNLGDVYAQLASQAYNKALQLDKSDTTVPPKLALLRELTAGSTSLPSTAVATTSAKPAVAVAAAVVASKPAAKPVPVPASQAATTVAAAKPTPAPAPTQAAAASAPDKTAAIAPAVAPAAAARASAPVVAKTPAAADDPVAEVQSAVQAWAAAWSRRDMDAYLAAYTPDFSGQSGSHKTWEQDRRDRITQRKQIKVELSELRISVNGDQATAKFRQAYVSDALSTTGRKTLQLVRTGQGKWVIKQEAVGG
jgi:Flp pilus assembly protein TadD/ketosteroid isomerase-like protein